MQDDKENQDDFEYDDFEDEAELEEVWDDLTEEKASAEDSAEEDLSAPVVDRKKTFIQKNFNMIIVAVAVLAALSVVFSMLGGGAKTPSVPESLNTQTAQEGNVLPPATGTVVSDLQAGEPPMPAPMEGPAPEDNAGQALSPEKSVDTVLTPMPEDGFPEETPASEGVIEKPASEAMNSEKESTPALERPSAPPPLALAPSQEGSASQDNAVAVLEALPSEALVIETPAESKESPAPEKQAVENPQRSDLEDTLLPPEEKIPEETLLPVPQKGPPPETQKIPAESPQQPLVEEAGGKTEKPAVSDSSQQKPVTPEPKKELAEAPAVSQEIKSKPKGLAKSEAIKPAVRWVLRSAQNGRAVIAPQGSHDLQNVSVGDSVKGLGRILSIQKENGLWVLRGTKGTLTQ